MFLFSLTVLIFFLGKAPSPGRHFCEKRCGSLVSPEVWAFWAAVTPGISGEEKERTEPGSRLLTAHHGL